MRVLDQSITPPRGEAVQKTVTMATVTMATGPVTIVTVAITIATVVVTIATVAVTIATVPVHLETLLIGSRYARKGCDYPKTLLIGRWFPCNGFFIDFSFCYSNICIKSVLVFYFVFFVCH